MRFDEIELEPVPFDIGPVEAPIRSAPRLRRLGALLIDLSLFAALALALSPLLPAAQNWIAITALAAFVLLVSYYYFVGTWMLWGKTIGGAIFDVRVVSDDVTMSLRAATIRWSATLLSLLTAGIGFVFGVPNRVSHTRCISG
jgi:uncharacterized RDD family membrane protein YckC